MTAQSLLFTSGNGSTLFATDGTTVVQLAGGTSSPPFLADPLYSNVSAASLGSSVYFTMADATAATSAIWSYDGTTVTQVTPSSGYVYNRADTNSAAGSQAISTYNGDLVFSQASLAGNTAGDGLFDTATLALYDPAIGVVSQLSAPNGGYDPTDFVTLNGTLYFEARDSQTNAGAIYSFDGTTVSEIYNLHPTFTFNAGVDQTVNAAGAVTGPLVAFNGNLYFGSGQQSVEELTSTVPLGNSATNVAGAAQYDYGSSPGSDLIVANDHLFFLSGNNGIYSLDAANTETQVLGSIGAQNFLPVAYDNAVYFAASDPATLQPNLYSSTGGAAAVVQENAGGSSFAVMGSTLFYNNDGAGLGTYDGASFGSLAVPAGAGGQPLAVVPIVPVSWGVASVPPPVVTAGSAVSFTGGDPAVTLDGGLMVSDPSSAMLASASVGITSGLLAGDLLGFTDQNGIAGRYDAVAGVLTLSGTASVADYQTALQSITYGFDPGNGDPTNGGADTERTVTWTVNDGVNASSPATSTLAAIHSTPTVTAGAAASFTGGGAPVVLDGALSVVDPGSSGMLQSASIAIGTGFLAGDLLGFTDQNGIAGRYDAVAGVLTLSGTASVADYQSALESVTYGFDPGNGDPTNGGTDTARAVTWTVNDGVNASSPATSTLAAIHAPPAVMPRTSAVYSGGDPATVLARSLTVSAPDSGGALQGATVSISSGLVLGDRLHFADQNGITGSYDAIAGVLRLSGSASAASYQAALDSVTYDFGPGNADPTGGGSHHVRTVSWAVDDGVATSSAAGSSLFVYHRSAAVHAGATAIFTGGGDPVALDGALTVTDPDSNGLLAGATVYIQTGLTAGDQLNFTDQNGITGRYDSHGTLTLHGTASIADYQTALDSITYSFDPGNGDPAGAPLPNQLNLDSVGAAVSVLLPIGLLSGVHTSRSIAWVVNDGVNNGSAFSVLYALHAPPTVSFPGASAAGLIAGAPDSLGRLAGASVSIGAGFLPGDRLGLGGADRNGIVSNYNGETGVLTLSGIAPVADYQAALRGVVFSNGRGDPTNGGTDMARTLSWIVNDGVVASAAQTTTVAVGYAPPVIGGTGASPLATTDETAVQPFATVTIADPNPAQTETATVTVSEPANGALSDGTPANGALAGVAGRYDAAAGVYVVSGTADQVTAALDGLVFTPAAHQVAPGGTVTTGFALDVVDTLGAASHDATTSVVATAVDDAPAIIANPHRHGVANQATSTPFATVTVADPDVGHVDTLSVRMSNPAGGVLSNLGGGAFDPVAGLYTASGNAADLTADLDGLVFIAAPPSNGFVATTRFVIGVTGPGGTATDRSSSVTTVTQVLGLAGAAAGDTAISPSTDGGTGAPVASKTNEAVITDPASGSAYELPPNYQAAFLEGTTDAQLSDGSVGGALLVGNGGNDTLSSGAANNTILGGSASNTIGVSGADNLVLAFTGTDTIQASGDRDMIVAGGVASVGMSGANQVAFGRFGDPGLGGSGLGGSGLDGSGLGASGPGFTLTLLSTGEGATVSAGASALNATLTGGAAAVFGGTGRGTGAIGVVASGAHATIVAGASAATIDAAGDGALIFGGIGSVAGALQANLGGASDTIVAGQSAATVHASGNGALLFGAFGDASGMLDATLGGASDTIVAGTSAASVTISGGGALVYGGSGKPGGTLSVLDQGQRDTVVAGTSAATVVAGAGSDALAVFGGTAGLNVTAGSGSATVVAGSGPASVTGGAGALVFSGLASASTVSGGAGGTTLFGGDGGSITYLGGAGAGGGANGGGAESGAYYVAGGGNETLNAGTSSGNDTIVAGTGSDTLTGGSGADRFMIGNAAQDGGARIDVIANFTALDTLSLAGYGANAAAVALAGAVSGGGSTTIMLGGDTSVTFLGFADASALAGRVTAL